MSKIAIISQADQGVLIDVSGCSSFREAIEHLASTLQVSNQFWKGTAIAINLGQLELNTTQVAQILAIAKGVGATPSHFFAKSGLTRTALREHNINLASGEPAALPEIDLSTMSQHDLNEDDVDDAVDLRDAKQGKLAASARDKEVVDSAVIFEEDMADQILETETLEEIEDADEVDVEAVTVTTSSDSEQAVQTKSNLPAVLYLRQNLRSGQTISHAGHLVIIGDVNPGAEIMAEGDITVWGALRGIAHAGIGGNVEAEIRALKLQPIQIRIAHAIARSPDRPRVKYALGARLGPETARIVDGKIRIARSNIE
ncbi:MAG: septum site-determining protein MinC [Candidatus Obscuribacterales bacterium]|nr:septum site-determining protein MinC [Candidatus Obscuribacterales bacterium]